MVSLRSCLKGLADWGFSLGLLSEEWVLQQGLCRLHRGYLKALESHSRKMFTEYIQEGSYGEAYSSF
jgi:hypothetical protein